MSGPKVRNDNSEIVEFGVDNSSGIKLAKKLRKLKG